MKIRGQKVTGNKPELLERLKKALKDKVKVKVSEQEKIKGKKKIEGGLKGFAKGARWEPLVPDELSVEEPTNPSFEKARAPTIDEEDAEHVPVKYNFMKYLFIIPIFTGVCEIIARYANGTAKKNKDGSNQSETIPQTFGHVYPHFVKDFNITPATKPEEYMDILLPFKKNVVLGKEYISFQQITSWTNLKAELAGAGPDGTCHKDFKRFSVNEIRQHFGLYVLQGLNPSPRAEWKFNKQQHDKVHGSDFVNRSFGPNAERRHKHFKSFLALQDP